MSGPRIDVLSMFPELVEGFLGGSLLGAARREGRIDVRVRDLRAYAHDRHRTLDDAPFGGGDGMVLKCEPVVAAVEAAAGPGARILALSPRGRVLEHARVAELAGEAHLVLVCGRYAGFDQRILDLTGAEELSIGDYVLAGGELAALVVVEAVSRWIPGVVGNPVSPREDSFADGLLEFPVYTRPREFRGRAVPEVLLSGDHAAIARWRRLQSLRLTRDRRPELFARLELSEEDRRILRELEHEQAGRDRD